MAVYFLQRKDGLIKIGHSSNPLKRKKSLQAKHGRLKELGFMRGDYIIETEIHRRFDDIRVSNEWFKPEQNLLDFINKKCSKTSFDNVFDYLWSVERYASNLSKELEHTKAMLERYREWHNQRIEDDLSSKPRIIKAG